MADGKWIDGLEPDMSIRDAASAILSVRLGSFRHQFAEAAQIKVPTIEQIHQLRVSTRRASAALKLLRPVLEKKPLRKAAKLLQRVRRAAGAARDWDVFAETTEATLAAVAKQEALSAFLSAYCLGARADVHADLEALYAEHAEVLDEVCDHLPNHLAGEIEGTLAELADESMPRLMFDFTEAIQATPTTSEGLHALRIQGKRLRYAMELFACRYTEPWQAELYPILADIQELLGRLQDGVVATAHATAILAEMTALRPEVAKGFRPGFTAMNQNFRKRATAAKPELRKAFTQWKKLMTKYPLPTLAKPTEAD